MKKIAFFDTKPYDRTWFDILAKHYEIAYFEEKLNRHTATLTDGFDAVCAFVNDRVDAAAIDRMHRCGVQLLALRCAGFKAREYGCPVAEALAFRVQRACRSAARGLRVLRAFSGRAGRARAERHSFR